MFQRNKMMGKLPTIRESNVICTVKRGTSFTPKPYNYETGNNFHTKTYSRETGTTFTPKHTVVKRGTTFTPNIQS